MTEERYRNRLDYEWSLADAQVSVLLDTLCRRWGLRTWRLPLHSTLYDKSPHH